MYTLRPTIKAMKSIGFAIIYGGKKDGVLMVNEDQFRLTEWDRIFIETDFGNHLSISQVELANTFELLSRQSYDRWRNDRDALRQQPNLIEDEINASIKSIQSLGEAYRARVASEVHVPEEWIDASRRAAETFEQSDGHQG